ncbi:MAG: CPBP family intramembrane glutamic endopeptidase [Gammaproteobacteria bacterium]
MKKLAPLIEVATVVGLFFYFRLVLKHSALAGWQESIFGAAPVSSSLLFFALPLLIVLATRRGARGLGLTTQQPGYDLRVAMPALAVVAPVTILFLLVQLLGSDPYQWLGGIILTIGFTIGGVVMTRSVSRIANKPERSISLYGLAGYAGVLAGGAVLIALIHPVAPMLGRVILVLVFVGLLEEVFFRGYVQTRLNESLGKPLRYRGVSFGAGLLITAVIFGLMHPLTASADTTPWAWALWTTTVGVILGYLREKTGAAVTPAIVHGVILLPGVLFGVAG